MQSLDSLAVTGVETVARNTRTVDWVSRQILTRHKLTTAAAAQAEAQGGIESAINCLQLRYTSQLSTL